ncbi:MAG: FHA domain-containing protein [Scytonema sp. RU_4_4]|nr:FHA domain-containing protein [Scytonema sp. RU_4_4]NJR74710.1 FHA domain-containing protein [Scytonema sp. CRU_2_7]
MFIPGITSLLPNAYLRSLSAEGKTLQLRAGVTRIGRTSDNDIVIPEPSLSRRHAEILCRNTLTQGTTVRTYYLQDLSTYGTTWVFRANVWQQIHRQEIPLESGMKLKFGSTRSQTWEFILEDS